MPIPLSTNSTLEYFDGFDDYNTAQISRYWNATATGTGTLPSISSGTGRNGTNSIRIGNDSNRIGISLVNQVTRTIGFAFKAPTYAITINNTFGLLCSFFDGFTEQVSLRLNTSGQFFFSRNGNNIGSFASQTLPLNAWNYIEVTVTINSSSGVVKLNLNGTTILSLTSQNTQATSNAFSNLVTLYNGYQYSGAGATISNPADYDDVYIRSDSTMMGDQTVETHFPSSNGATNLWTPLASTNFSQVNESAADDNTSYNSTSIPTQTDLFSFSSLSLSSGVISAVMTTLQEAVDTSGVASSTAVYRNTSGTVYPGATQFIGAVGYSPYFDIQGQDPATSAAWTVSSVNSYQYGIQRLT